MIFTQKSLKDSLMPLVSTSEAINKAKNLDPFSIDSLLHAFTKCKKDSIWKGSVQFFESDLLSQCYYLNQSLNNHTYKTNPYNEFELNERGKIRHIKALTIRDRVVIRSLCDNVLIPKIAPKLIYDNFASLENRGINFARKRFLFHLHKYTRKHGVNGYILQLDFSKFFDSIDHELCKKEFSKVIDCKYHWLIDHIIDSFGGSKGVGIGSQISQIAGIFYPHYIDNHCKIKRRCLYYGRYMDDIYIIHHNKAFLQNLLAEIYQIANSLKLTINPKKTHIIPLNKRFIFLKSIYTIKDSGQVIYTQTQKGLRREKRRLYKLRHKYDLGLIPASDIDNAFKSWCGNVYKNYPHTSYFRLKYIKRLYNQLFGDLLL